MEVATAKEAADKADEALTASREARLEANQKHQVEEMRLQQNKYDSHMQT